MSPWIALTAVIPAEDVAPRSYFLMQLATPEALWGLRMAALAVALLLLVLYRKTK